MSALITLIRTEAVRFARDKQALILMFIFPLVFIIIFGFLMKGSSTPRLGVVVAGSAAPTVQAVLAPMSDLHVIDYPNRSALIHAVEKGQADFGLYLDGDVLHFVYNPTQVQNNPQFMQIAAGITTQYNLARQRVTPIVRAEKVVVGKNPGGWLNLVVPGIIAFSILTAGLTGISGHLTMMKERRLLDRFVATPMRPTMLLVAIGAVRAVMAYIASLITLITAIGLLHLHFAVNWWQFTVFVLAATVGSMALGTIIALFVRRPASAGNIANILAMVMMFFSGVYFPVELMPGYLRTLAMFLPLTYMVNGMQVVTGVSAMGAARFWTITAALFGTGAILFPVLAHYVVQPERR